jgi:hypothetical protein
MMTSGRTWQDKTDVELPTLGIEKGDTDEMRDVAIEQEFEAPLRMAATFPTPDSKLNFTVSPVSAADNAKRSLPPLKGTVSSLVSSTIDFQAKTTTGATFLNTWPTGSTLGYFRRVGFTTANGIIQVVWSAEAATLGGLPNAGTVLNKKFIPLGWVDLQCTDATNNLFKSANELDDIITNTTIYRFGSGGSGGGSGIDVYDTVALATAETNGGNNDISEVVETETFYRYSATAHSAYTANGLSLLAVTSDANARWVGVAGRYPFVTISSSVPAKSPADGFNCMAFDYCDQPPTSSLSKVDSVLTTATYNISTSTYSALCDKTKLISITGNSFVLSATPTGFALAVNNIIWVNSLNRFFRVMALGSTTSGTLDVSLGTPVTNAAGMVSQAVWTKDLVNCGDPVQLTRPRDFFPATNVAKVHVDYYDSLVPSDNIPDYTTTARMVCSGTNAGLQSDVTVPSMDTFTPIFTRPVEPNQVLDLPLIPNSPQERCIFVFFPNPNFASVTTTANLVNFEISFYEKTLFSNGGVLASAYCMTDGTGTMNGCVAPTVVGGKTRVTLLWSYLQNLNPGTPHGDIEVEVEGMGVPRFYPGVVGAYYTEVLGVNNAIDLYGDLSAQSYSVSVKKRQGSMDQSAVNSLRLNSLNTAIVGLAADVLAGIANYTTLSSAVAAVGALGGGSVLVLPRTIVDTFTWGAFPNVSVRGFGRLSVITGNIIMNSNYCELESLRVNGNLTVSGNNNFLKVWLPSTAVFTNSGTGNNTRVSVE